MSPTPADRDPYGEVLSRIRDAELAEEHTADDGTTSGVWLIGERYVIFKAKIVDNTIYSLECIDHPENLDLHDTITLTPEVEIALLERHAVLLASENTDACELQIIETITVGGRATSAMETFGAADWRNNMRHASVPELYASYLSCTRAWRRLKAIEYTKSPQFTDYEHDHPVMAGIIARLGQDTGEIPLKEALEHFRENTPPRHPA